MRAKDSVWYELVIRAERENDKGERKHTKEAYTAEACSFAEAEAVAMAIEGVEEVVNINPAPYTSVVCADGDTKYYKVKASVPYIDENTGKEKHTAGYFLSCGDTLEEARAKAEGLLRGTLAGGVICAVTETKILDVIFKK